MGCLMGIDTGNQALTTCFFISRCAINLTSEKEVFNGLRHERMMELSRVEKVVFYGISRSVENYVL